MEYMQTLPPGTDWLFPSPSARRGHTVDVRKAFVRCVIGCGWSETGGPSHPSTHSDNALSSSRRRPSNREAHQRPQDASYG